MSRIVDREFLYSRVNATKKALVNEWQKEGCFKDRNNFKKSGLIPEGVGLTSLLLLFVAFKEDENVFSVEPVDGDVGILDLSEVINASFKKIFEWTAFGFGAAPLLNKKNAALFDIDRGYTETVTWCLSASILALYAENKLALSLEKEVHEGVLTLLGRSFKALLTAQRPDGTWGFTTDGKGSRSLYFTYIANASLADFFDYILDEINIVETANGEKKANCPMVDVIAFLDEHLGVDSVALARTAREKLDEFLIKTCLPLLPELARCEEMSDEALNALGAWITAPYADEKAKDKKFYHNLYYTYYILDMMITASADEYFNKLVGDVNNRDALLRSFETRMEPYEFDYYSSEDHFTELFTNFYEQALHSSRVNYMSAARTGETFWDMTASELPVRWNHENSEIQKMAKIALDQSQATLSDPTILPMALRANTVYSYYVTEKPEITVERLFSDVCANVYVDEVDEDDDEHVKDLWDVVYYNLMITERSIESIVDFYDYLNKFEHKDATFPKNAETGGRQTKTEQVVAPSAIDVAIEAKIAEYLASDAGKKAIEAACGDRTVVAVSVPEDGSSVGNALPATFEQLAEWMENITKDISQIALLNSSNGSELMLAMVELFEALQSCSLRKKGGSAELKKDPAKLSNYTTEYEKQSRLLLQAILKDIAERAENNNMCDLKELYEALKKYRMAND